MHSQIKVYVQAIMSLDLNKESLKSVAQEMLTISNCIHSSDILKNRVFSSALPISKKCEILSELVDIASKNTHNISDTTVSILKTLIHHNKIQILHELCINLINTIKNDDINYVPVKFTSATKLSNDQKRKLESTAHKQVKGKLEITYEIQPNLLAGVIVDVGSQRLDFSMLKKITDIKKMTAN